MKLSRPLRRDDKRDHYSNYEHDTKCIDWEQNLLNYLRGLAYEGPCRGANVHAIEEFGQLLRHERNNPLSGILGNAELLLSEVRLRETVRRLSQETGSGADKVFQGNAKLV
jgi:signal transduction histidine kinase